MAPMTAASRTNDSAQNGSRYGSKMLSLSSAVETGAARLELIVAEAVDQHVRHDAEHQQGNRDAERPVLVVEVGLAADACAGQHDAEQEQDHHRADVDEHLGDRDELGGQQQVLGRGAGHHDDQRQRGVDDVAAAHDVDARRRS